MPVHREATVLPVKLPALMMGDHFGEPDLDRLAHRWVGPFLDRPQLSPLGHRDKCSDNGLFLVKHWICGGQGLMRQIAKFRAVANVTHAR